MFKRINTGLFNPSEIKNFINDKLRFVWLYILFLSVLISIPAFIQLSLSKSVDDDIKETLVSNIQSKNLEGKIEDYKYTGETIDPVGFNEQFFIGAMTDDVKRLGLVFIFNEEKLEIFIGGNALNKYTYEQLDFETFDFKLTQKVDRDKLKDAIDVVFADYKGLYNTTFSFAAVINSFLTGLFLILMLTVVTAFSFPKMVLRYRFIMSTYASTVYFLSLLFETLFNVKYLSFIGIVISIIFIRKAQAGFFKHLKENIRKEEEDE